jgi:hypothetical protein
MSGPPPDFDRLIADARTTRTPVTLTEAQEILGNLFEEHLADQETLIVPKDGPIALTATSWIRVLQRAQAKGRRAP